MNTSEFLEGYKEIKRMIQENLEEISRTYDIPKKYQYNYFFIEQRGKGEIRIEFVAEYINEYRFEYVNLPL